MLTANNNVTWTCTWQRPGSAASAVHVVKSDPVLQDMHRHTLIVTCPIPSLVLSSDVDVDGRYRYLVAVKATLVDGTVLSHYIGVPVCSSGINPPLLPTAHAGLTSSERQGAPGVSAPGLKTAPASPSRYPIYLAACTMVTENARYDAAALTKVWATYLIKNGAGHIVVYVDSNPSRRQMAAAEVAAQVHAPGQSNGTSGGGEHGPGAKPRPEPGARRQTTFEAHLESVLGAEIKQGLVALVLFNRHNRMPFYSQQVQQNHCLWRFKNVAKWLVQTDIDEFMQPLRHYKTLRDVIADVEKHPVQGKRNSTRNATRKVAAFEVNQLVRGHLVTEDIPATSVEVWKMKWFRGGKPRPNLPSAREKLILNTQRAQYLSVHRLTTTDPQFSKTSRLSAEKQVRMLHFRHHFKTDKANENEFSWFRVKTIGQPNYDDSFYHHFSNLTHGHFVTLD